MCSPVAGAVIGGAANFIGAASAANAENRARKQEYESALQQREVDWMNQLSIAGAERIQYEQGIDESSLALARGFTQLDAERNALIAKALQADEKAFQKYSKSSTSSQLKASGSTGRSVNRIATIDLADYLREGSREAYKLTQNEYAFKESAKALRDQAKADRSQLWANVRLQKIPGAAPPKPVYKNPLVAGISGAISGAMSGAQAGKALQ